MYQEMYQKKKKKKQKQKNAKRFGAGFPSYLLLGNDPELVHISKICVAFRLKIFLALRNNAQLFLESQNTPCCVLGAHGGLLGSSPQNVDVSQSVCIQPTAAHRQGVS